LILLLQWPAACPGSGGFLVKVRPINDGRNALNLRRPTENKKYLPKQRARKTRRSFGKLTTRRATRKQAHESRIYSNYASLYDRTFGRIFYNRIEQVIASLNIPPGAKVLELGVGTGVSFPAYPKHCTVTGIDLAPDMLAQANAKISTNGWSHLQVMQMDALHLNFPSDTFDYVTTFHTVTVVPDPVQMLSEAKRVCRPGGKIVIVNHFTSELPIVGPLTEALDPLTRHLGWSTKLKLDEFLAATGLTVEAVYKLSKSSLYTIIRGRVL
jgi:phosphatidylethanolamine/phosphatidyl-N-methylethanolamine N-methyltransferase